MRFASRRRRGVSSIVGSIFFVLIMVVAIGSLVTIFNSFATYNQQVTKAGNSNAQLQQTSLSITSGQFGSFPPSTTSNFNVATTSCATSSTQYTNQGRLFFSAGMWWDFFTCNSNYQYSSSFDGVAWSTAANIPNLVTGYTVGPYFEVTMVGSTFYLAIAKLGAPRFQFGSGTLVAGGTNSAPAGTISWTNAPAELVPTAATNAIGPIQLASDSAGNQWVAMVEGTCSSTADCSIAVYEHEACATGAGVGWEPSLTCSASTAPITYAPASAGSIYANAEMILLAPPSSLSSTGVVMIFQGPATGSTTHYSTGPLTVVTQDTLATTTWHTGITLSGINDYSLSSSSALFIGNTIYLAGLESASGSPGATSGNLRFWTLAFTSISAATNSGETSIETSSQAWMAALTSLGTTLALFDAYPTATTVQYYVSSTLGSIWNSPAIVLVTGAGDTAVNGLAPASGGFAVTWANGAPNVRFAALSSITVSNNSPFSVHLVDLYVQNSGANSLVAHWYYNSTEDFDYWVSQGGTMTIPFRFIWTASTGYLFTVSTDTGVTAQLTATSLPSATVSCGSNTFLTEVSPATICSSGSTNPTIITGAGAETCSDSSTSSKMMGLGMSYTTKALSSGSLYFSLAFEVATPATTTVSSSWQVFYGTGTAPTCNGSPAGTAIGQSYAVYSQAAVVRDLSQSVSASLTGLFPATTYWFDLQVTDGSANAWTYSNPDMSITDVLTTNQPKLTTSTNTNSCPDSTLTTAKMMGLGTTFTTGGAGFTGNVFAKLTFEVANSATSASGTNTKYTVAYGTGSAPACNAAATGTTVGNQYTVGSQAAVAGGAAAKAGFVLTGLTASTTYWVDVQAADSTATNPVWTYSNPTLAVMEVPTPTNSLPNVATNSNANTCTDVTPTVSLMGGLGVKYTIPSSATGNLYLTLNFQVTGPTHSGVTSQWQVSYGTGAPPSCNVYFTGVIVGNVYTVSSQSNQAGAIPQSETFVLPEVQKIAGTTIWVDVQVLDSSGDSWTYSNPALSVATFPE